MSRGPKGKRKALTKVKKLNVAGTHSHVPQYDDCIVTFIDVLGFREIVKTRSAADVHEIIRLLLKFTTPDDEDNFDSEGLMSKPLAQSVSDAVVRVRNFNTTYRDGAFFHELLDLLHAQIELVALGVLVRGGLTVGKIYSSADGSSPFFGPALIRAYDIESKEAIYPRIVVDREALAAHRSNKGLQSENNTLAYELEKIGEFLATDEDGLRFLDYLRAGESEIDEGGFPEFISRHAALIKRGYAASATDPKVKQKYEWLAKYHNACVIPMREAVLSSKSRRESFEYEYEIAPEDFFAEVIVLK